MTLADGGMERRKNLFSLFKIFFLFKDVKNILLLFDKNVKERRADWEGIFICISGSQTLLLLSRLARNFRDQHDGVLVTTNIFLFLL